MKKRICRLLGFLLAVTISMGLFPSVVMADVDPNAGGSGSGQLNDSTQNNFIKGVIFF